jgi:hypothetical protein
MVFNNFHNNESSSNIHIKFKGKGLIIINVYLDDSILPKNNVDLRMNIRYMKGTIGRRLMYRKTNKLLVLQDYSNAIWVGDIDMKRPTLGNSFVNEAIRWEKAMVVSNTKLEYMAWF